MIQKVFQLILIIVATVTLICSSSLSVYQDLVIQVSEHKGSDNETCFTVPNSFCQSLEFIASNLQNYSHNITIVLDSRVLLRNQVTFNNSEFLTIKGRHKSGKIICIAKCKKGDYGGMSFMNAHYLMLSNFRITSCCGTSNIYYATLLLYSCFDIIITYISMYRSANGSALVLTNPQGVVSINSCTFRRNGRTQRLASNTSFAGGIHLEFSEQVKTNITIQKCKFYDNMTPRYDAKKLVSPTDWNGNSIGGGMCVALLESTSGVNIQIMNSIFHNNNANWGGGLCICLQKHTHNNHILILNSTFTRNRGNLGGGGAHVRLDEQESGLENYILFKRVTFINNSKFWRGDIHHCDVY